MHKHSSILGMQREDRGYYNRFWRLPEFCVVILEKYFVSISPATTFYKFENLSGFRTVISRCDQPTDKSALYTWQVWCQSFSVLNEPNNNHMCPVAAYGHQNSTAVHSRETASSYLFIFWIFRYWIVTFKDALFKEIKISLRQLIQPFTRILYDPESFWLIFAHGNVYGHSASAVFANYSIITS